MAWTPWRKIADSSHWFVDHCLRIPVCYELALGRMDDREEPVVVHVGAALSEAGELERFDTGEHPLLPRAQAELDAGLAIYYRAFGAPTLAQAEALRDERAATYESTPAWDAE